MQQSRGAVEARFPFRVICAALVIGLVIAACGSGGDDDDVATEQPDTEATETTETSPTETDVAETEGTEADEAEDQEESASEGGMLRIASAAEPSNLDPRTNATEFDRNVVINVYNSLLEFDLEDFSLQPSLATSWEFSDDGLAITLELEEGVLFHDGSEMTADDVVFTILENADPDNIRTGAALARVEDVVAVDDYTVEIQLSEPDALIPETLVDVYVRPDGWEYDPDALIGTGPFKFVSWDRNQAVVLERNEDYWREGFPLLDEVHFENVADDQTRVLRLEAGEIDMVPVPPFTLVERLQEGGFNMVVPTGGAGAVYDLRFNVRTPPWDDVRVRQALNHALDREAIETALLGVYEPISNPVPEDSPFFSPTAPSYKPRDLDRARELLAEAGYPDGVDAGTMMNHYELGFDFEVLSQVIQSQAAEAGIRMELENFDVATWVDNYLSPEGWGVGLSNGLARPTPYDLIAHTWGKGRPAAQGHDETMPEFLELLEETRGLDPESDEFREGLQELQVIAMTELPSIAVGTKPLPIAMSDAVTGFEGHPSGFVILEQVGLS